MIFEAGLAELVMAGRKTETRRLCTENPRSPWYSVKCAMVPGKVVKVNPGRGVANIGEIRIVGVEKERLGDTFATNEAGEYVTPVDSMRALLAYLAARAEGFEDAAEFVREWARINGSWNPDALVWVVKFRVVL